MIYKERIKEPTHSTEDWIFVGAVALLSFVLGVLTFGAVKKHKTLKADDLLKSIKKEFLKEGPIDGSWIELTKVPWNKFAYETDVYYGGVSRYEENKLVQYEFIVDAYTGSLIDLYRV
ncbi:PepSY domain-containing protein [Alkalibacterium olivapovliticus]|uniref:Putative small secreted protein n=1 Tax=Alkalibacterium olivapovliticus TaxID=99907 RepID=A0A2T0W2A6_9LACT|nr:PepSY domain-containing protein [Alkalibacterium olivapovliticus]PRY79073.1 putative small secreted protein [Alkalibacterium olivapovliticus]